MGIKFLNLQMIPWCFQHLSCLHIQSSEPAAATVKLIKSDGLVTIYDRPIHVSELLVEYPKHLVCRSDSFYIGQKIPSLSENDQLQLGHKYFLLPKQCFQSVLSFVTIASFSSSFIKDSRYALLKKAAACQPFDIQKSPSGCLRIRVSDEFISQLMEESQSDLMGRSGECESSSMNRVCTTPQLQKDYRMLVASRQWKPKLETIREKKEKRKLSSFGIITRNKNSQSKGIQSHKSLETSKPCSKAKIKIKLRK